MSQVIKEVEIMDEYITEQSIHIEQTKKNMRLSKRIFDILFSLFAITVFFIPMLCIAFFIKLYSPDGGVFFKQKRLGLNGKEFDVWKFRTMVPDAEEKLQELLDSDEEIKKEYLTYRKLKNDVRIIPKIGSFLRTSSLDELPQFFNVLFGTMSVVGPRPYMEAEFNDYTRDTVNIITSVKPGITGYWQVIPSRHDTTFKERVESDLSYIKQKSFYLDIKIIVKTVLVMGLGKGA